MRRNEALAVSILVGAATFAAGSLLRRLTNAVEFMAYSPIEVDNDYFTESDDDEYVPTLVWSGEPTLSEEEEQVWYATVNQLSERGLIRRVSRLFRRRD
jgi:hypothetical protein